MRELNAREHIIVSYAILGTAVVALSFAVLQAPIAQRWAFAESLARLRPVYAKSIAAIERSRVLETLMVERQAGDDTRRFYDAETAALAGAILQNELQTVITAEGGMLISSAFRQSTESTPVAPVGVAVRLRCSVEALMRILHSLEGHQPVLFVENVVVQSNHRLGAEMRNAADELDVEFDVTGYLDRALPP